MATEYIITTEGAPNLIQETVIDGFLTDDDADALYKKWRKSWPTPLEFSGGVLGISCEQVLEVPSAQFNRTFGKVRGERIKQVAEVNANA
jgi:hypothetical protein